MMTAAFHSGLEFLQNRGVLSLSRAFHCRWHWEMAQLNVVVRTLIRIAFGTALPSGSHADALESYRQATGLNPARLVHRCGQLLRTSSPDASN